LRLPFAAPWLLADFWMLLPVLLSAFLVGLALGLVRRWVALEERHHPRLLLRRLLRRLWHSLELAQALELSVRRTGNEG
jgi:hypothetical protein